MKPWLICTLLLGLALLPACAGFGPQPTPTLEPLPEEAFAPLVSVTGVVLPQQKATLSVTTAGVIASLAARLGDVVAADQVLLELEGKEALEAQAAAARLELVLAQQALDTLQREHAVQLAAAQQAVVAAERTVDDSQRRLRSLQSTSAQTDIDQAQATVILLRDQLDKARQDYAPYENKPEDNLVRAALLSQLAQVQQQYDAAVRRLNNLSGTASDLDLREAEAALEVAQTNLTAAQKDLADLQGGPNPDLVEATEARLGNTQAQLAAVQAAQQDLNLLAPFAGTVSELYVNPGEWIAPGQPVLLLADLEDLQIETTDLSEIDVAQIAVGDQAKITFDAFPGFTTTGQVVRIAPKAAQGSGVNYAVVLDMDEQPPDLRWGMTAFVDLQPSQAR